MDLFTDVEAMSKKLMRKRIFREKKRISCKKYIK